MPPSWVQMLQNVKVHAGVKRPVRSAAGAAGLWTGDIVIEGAGATAAAGAALTELLNSATTAKRHSRDKSCLSFIRSLLEIKVLLCGGE
jgi:hypothetical protein